MKFNGELWIICQTELDKYLDYVSDYELESACNDPPCVAPSRVN